MVKKNVKYVDFNGVECSEVLYFNLSRSECTMLEVAHENGMASYIEEVVKSGDRMALLQLFSKVILDSYGVKSDDGKRFIKSAKLKEEFSQSLAYEQIFLELATDPEVANSFMKNVVQQ